MPALLSMMGFATNSNTWASGVVAIFILVVIALWMMSNALSKAQAYGAQFGDACWDESGQFFSKVYVVHSRIPAKAVRVEANGSRCHIWTNGNWIPGERASLVDGRGTVVGTANAAAVSNQPVLADVRFNDGLVFVDRPWVIEFMGNIITGLYILGYCLSVVIVLFNGVAAVLKDGGGQIGDLVIRAVVPSSTSLVLLTLPPLFMDSPGGPILHLGIGVYVVFLVFPVLAIALPIIPTALRYWPK